MSQLFYMQNCLSMKIRVLMTTFREIQSTWVGYF
jgi:hypothetical protein